MCFPEDSKYLCEMYNNMTWHKPELKPDHWQRDWNHQDYLYEHRLHVLLSRHDPKHHMTVSDFQLSILPAQVFNQWKN